MSDIRYILCFYDRRRFAQSSYIDRDGAASAFLFLKQAGGQCAIHAHLKRRHLSGMCVIHRDVEHFLNNTLAARFKQELF